MCLEHKNINLIHQQNNRHPLLRYADYDLQLNALTDIREKERHH